MSFLDLVLGHYAPLLITELIPASHGLFEVELDGDLIFSRKQKGRFPKYADVQPELAKRLGAPPHWRETEVVS